MDDKIAVGVIGTCLSAAGAGLSVTEIQAIISIIITVTGFVISVLIPSAIKLYAKFKEVRNKHKNNDESSEEEVSEKSEGDK